MRVMKKMTALVLSLCMILAMGLTAFATEPTTPTETTTKTLSIKEPVEGHTYKVYQLLTGDVAADLSDGSATLSNVVKGSSLKDTEETADEIAKALKDKSGAELGEAAYAYIDTAKEVATLSTTTTSTQVAPGYYIIVDASYDGEATENVVYSRYMVAVVGDTEVEPKTSTPSIDKVINDGETDPNAPIDGDKKKTDTAAIGDEIEFKITGQVPNTEGYKYYYYVVNDTMSEGLTLKADSFKVTVGGTEITKGTDYYVYTGTDAGEYTFQLAFADLVASKYQTGAEIVVTYTATVNANAKTGTEANTNDAKLVYSNKPGDSDNKDKHEDNKPGVPDGNVPKGETPHYITKTYVTELNLIKVDQDGMPLKGAEFTLTGKNLNQVIIRTDYTFTADAKGTYYKLADGTYTTTKPTATVKDGDGKVTTEGNCDKYDGVTDNGDGTYTGPATMYARTTVVSTTTTSAADQKIVVAVNDNGFATITGLNAGEYELEETKVPDGYNKAPNVSFKIKGTTTNSKDTEGGDITWSQTDADSKVTYDEASKTFVVTIENVQGNKLPSTGGIGTTIFYVVGGLMMVGAVVLLVTKKRMSNNA